MSKIQVPRSGHRKASDWLTRQKKKEKVHAVFLNQAITVGMFPDPEPHYDWLLCESGLWGRSGVECGLL